MTRIEFFEFGKDALPVAFLNRVRVRSQRISVYWLIDNPALEEKLRQRFADHPIEFIQPQAVPPLGVEAILINSTESVPRHFGRFDELWELVGIDVDLARMKFEHYRHLGYALSVTQHGSQINAQTTANSEQRIAPGA